MELKKLTLSLSEDMIVTPVKGSVDLTQNSHSSQYIVVKLEGWKLEEGHTLWIGFEKTLKSGLKYTINHIVMVYYPAQDFYLIPAPEDLFVTEPGEWNFSISNRWDFSEGDGGNVRYKSLNSTNYTLVVKNSIMDASGNYISDADLEQCFLGMQIYLKEAVSVRDDINNAKDAAQTAQQLAEQAREYAVSAAGQAEESVQKVQGEFDGLREEIRTKADNLFYNTENGKLYPMSDGEIIGDGVVVKGAKGDKGEKGDKGDSFYTFSVKDGNLVVKSDTAGNPDVTYSIDNFGNMILKIN